MKKVFLIFFLALFLVKPTQAIYNPLSVPNNRFGIHIINENDLKDAALLVNSSQGDWGYVKLVIPEDDRDVQKWQAVFNQMRRLHLIPIIRLATKVENGMWVKPQETEIGNWVEFLDSLNWVTRNRYVIIFNEPNHAKEWGGDINPPEYAWFLKTFSQKLKEKHEDFFILPAGFDASAASTYQSMDELKFIQVMLDSHSDIFDHIDGWTSHSYPNPEFSGSPADWGRGTVRTYQWELEQLSQLGVYNLPVFITETGWKHSLGKQINGRFATPSKVAENYINTFQYAWSDSRIVTVIPFLLNYQDAPFDHFSWKKVDSEEFHPMYDQVQAITKASGSPKQSHSAKLLPVSLPKKIVTKSSYSLRLDIENIGQSILGSDQGWEISLAGLPSSFEILTSNISSTEPFFRTRLDISINTPEKTGYYPITVNLVKNDQTITSLNHEITLIPPPSILVYAKTWFRKLAHGGGFSLLIYDQNNSLIQQKQDLVFDQGFADVENLYDIIPNQTYKLVLTKPYYLPSQVHTMISETKTGIAFPTLLPLDPSNDSKLSWRDLQAAFERPLETIGLWMSL